MTRRLALIVLAAAIVAGAGWYFVARRPGHIDGVRSVLLISIDTCRADRLSCYGAKRKVTPNIDALARDGVLFEAAITPVPLTTPAHASLLTGTYPPAHGVRLNNGEALPESRVTLAEVLRDAGYRTAAFVGGFPLDASFGLAQGFETYDGQFTRKIATSTTVAERTAEEVATPAIAWLEQHAKGPFFLFVHFFDAHLPYEPPPPFAATFADDPYSGEIAYIDASIGRILDKLQALGAKDGTLVVVTADHGESLDEHGEKSHGYFLYQSTLHVPLVMRLPGDARGTRVTEPVGLIDLMPTILDLVGVKAPPGIQGASLRAALQGERATGRPRALYSESLVATQFRCAPLTGIVERGWKYIGAPRPELYNMTEDPGEKKNVVEIEVPVAERMRERLETLLHEFESAAPERGNAAPDPEAVQRLQSLGYVGGGAIQPGLTDPKDFIATYERLEKANALLHSNRSAEAAQELEEIARAHPDLPAPEELLAEIARRDRRLGDVVLHRARVVAILEASSSREELPTAYFNLAFALREAGRDDEAIAIYRKALAIKPDYVEAHNSLGLALARLGRLDEAIGHYEQALSSNPDHAQAHNNLGAALERQGKPAAAIEHYTRALAIKPDYAGALSRLAWIKATSVEATLRNGPEALGLAERAVAITNRSLAFPLDALAAAYAESGRFEDAVRSAGEAAAAARAAGDAATAAQINTRLSGYRQGHPARAPSR